MKDYSIRVYVHKIFHGFHLNKMYFDGKIEDFFVKEDSLLIKFYRIPTVGTILYSTKGPLRMYRVMHHRFFNEKPKPQKRMVWRYTKKRRSQLAVEIYLCNEGNGRFLGKNFKFNILNKKLD